MIDAIARPFVIGIAGGSGAGKSTLVKALVAALGADAVAVLEHDWYYHPLEHLTADERAVRNFDHPDSLETSLLVSHLRALLAGQSIVAPQYDFERHTRKAEGRAIEPRALVVVEGILALADVDLVACFDLAVYVETSGQLCVGRRTKRDIAERGRSEESVRQQISATVAPMFDMFVAPSRSRAHIAVSGEKDVALAVDAIAQRVRSRSSAAESVLLAACSAVSSAPKRKIDAE